MLHLNGFGWLSSASQSNQLTTIKTPESYEVSPDSARDEIWARRPIGARRKAERRKSSGHERIHGSVCKCDTGTRASAESEDERVRVERTCTLSAQEALRAERTWVVVYLRVIRDLPFVNAICHFFGTILVVRDAGLARDCS